MYLKSIKAYGFKSFADKTEFNFCKDINGIVGPNGSGKSNVVDAVRWVLGEQSIKSLRGETTSDVIFSGSKSRKPLNSASVTLIFDNSDLYLPINYTEVSIKRVLYRSGENEYYLNNEKCRLKDITNLLTDTGADKESYNIIGQGKIDEILSTKPTDRRIIFESAAGVLKYKKRKEEATKKLERTNNNMDRVNDIIRELENNLEPLEKQSKDANEFLKLKEELNNLDIALMVHDIEYYNHNMENLKERIDNLNDDLVKLSRNHSGYDIELMAKKDKLKKCDEEINNHQNTLIEITKSIEKIDADIRVLKTKKEMNISLDENKFLKLKEELLQLETDINVLKNKEAEQDGKSTILKENLKNENQKKQELIFEKTKLSSSLDECNREKTNLKYQIDVLENSISSDASIPSSVKNILHNKRLSGVHNILGRLIEMDDEYHVAIMTSLGNAINYLVVDTSRDAKEMVNYLKENHLGRATFFPMDSVKSRKIDTDILNKIKKEEGFISIASDIVKRNSIYDAIVENQLGSVILTKNLDTANKISKLINNRYKIVTLDGQVVNVGGTITGGSITKYHNYLKDKYELQKCKQRLSTYEDKEKDLLDRLKMNTELFNKKEIDINSINQELLTLTNNKESMINYINNKNNELSRLNEEVKDVEAINTGEEDKRLDNMLTLYYSAISNRDNIQKEKDLTIAKKENLEKEIEELEEISKKDDGYINAKEKELKDMEIKSNSLNIRLDHLLISLGEEYGITFEKARESYQLDIEEDLARDRVKDLKERIKALGYVNISSIEEYEKVKNRYDFLIKQKEDLKDAENTLLEIIQEMDEIMKERFLKTFEAIRIEFKQVFKEMFGGGVAELVLTEPDNLLETGIEIEAVPSGKVLKSISLLSGGEKTFTAISLLFAILNIRPVPFCLLDEVEAALDEANVESFGNYLNKYKDKTQFILITHKKKTMEFADILYGITMQESGVSKLVSVRLEDLKETA